MRRFRRRRSIAPRQVIQSYKNVGNVSPASVSAGTQTNHIMTFGVDNYAGPTAGQNYQVPTGAVVKYIDVQVALQNLVNIASFAWVTIQHMRSGQSPVDAQSVGGNAQRNQVHLQLQRCIGQNQNVNLHLKFKVPRKFQRVREGDVWYITTKSDTIRTEAVQFIYKFYR